jgi:hypothetical protein
MHDHTTDYETHQTTEYPAEQREPTELQQPGLTEDELAQQEASDLPDRENMSLVNANVAAPVNLAAALNVLSDNSTAEAVAVQNAPVDQNIG